MSYNIDTFKVTSLEELKIPIAAFFASERKDWHPELSIDDDLLVTITNMGSKITGTILGGIFSVLTINCSGEGSGYVMGYMLEPSLKESTGILIATCGWKGDDLFKRLCVCDGVVEWENIEI